MKISIPSDKLIEYLTKYIENGKPEIIGEEIEFYGRKLAYPNSHRLAHILLYINKPEYDKLAFSYIEHYPYHVCHFMPMMLSKMVFNFGERMPDGTKKVIVDYLKNMRDEFIGSELDFVGVNDNFPMMSTYTAVSMYKLFGDDEMLIEAKRRISQLKSLLKRRGVMSEYNSYCYTPIQLFVLASLDKIAPDEEFRQIAINAQHRIWLDYLSHYHPATGMLTGPFSRQYAVAPQGKDGFINALFFGGDIAFDAAGPKDYHAGVASVYFMLEKYDCNDEAIKLIHNKEYPFEFCATSEFASSTDATPEAPIRNLTTENDFYEYPAGVAGIYTYQTEYYGIGMANHEWHNGVQTGSFTLNYKTTKSGENTRCFYTRYLLNDETKEQQPFMDQGRKMAFGKENKALLLYKPKVMAKPPQYHGLPKQLEENYKKQEISGNAGVTSAKLSILAYLDGKIPDKILLGDTEVLNCTATSHKAETVYIKDGDMYIAIHPLEITDLGRKNAIKIRLRGEQLEISFYNYQGEKRDFSKSEFIHTRNGFYISVASQDEIESFEEFVKKEKNTKIIDRYITTNHARQTNIRNVEVLGEGVDLACEYSPASEGIKYITSDGNSIEFPKISVSGIDLCKFPYI